MTWRTPAGWGIGVPIGDTWQGAEETAQQRIQRVLASTNAAWYQTWTVESYNGADPRFVPAAESGAATGLKLASAIEGCMLVLCEPERGWHAPISTPRGAAAATISQLQALDQMGGPYGWAAPGCNVNGKNLEWLAEYAAILWQRGTKVPTYWAIHLYGRKVSEVNYHWQRFLDWHTVYGGGRQVVVSEIGPGGGSSQAEQVAMMEFARRVLDDRRVLGVAYFAGGTAYQGHPDVCADPVLLERFRELA